MRYCRCVISASFSGLKLMSTSAKNQTGVKSPKCFDLVVIGGGSGGLACAKEAASLGKDVAVLDYVTSTPKGTTWGIGGTCVNVGCIPKKLMHHIAQMRDVLEGAHDAGWSNALVSGVQPRFEWAVMAERVQNYVKSLNWGHRVALREKKVEYFNARGSFVDSETLKAIDKNGVETTIKAKYFVIAVGGRPKYPNIPGAKEYGITSDDVFWLKKSPGKTLVVGASYVALECAGFLKAFGCDTTVMIRSIPLRGFDRQMAEAVAEHMEKEQDIKFIYGAEPTGVVISKDKFKVTWKNDSSKKEESDIFETVLFAIGRQPCTEYLNLNVVNVKVNPQSLKIESLGKLCNQERERTSTGNIYAIGDVIEGGVELTPVAIKAGKLLARRLFNKEKTLMDYELIPTTVFTPLEYSSVGMTEEDARHKLGDANIEVYHCYYKPLEYIALGSQQSCYIKLICNLKSSEKVVGLHILGLNAGEIMQGFAVAIKNGLTKQQLTAMVGIHPTSAEEVVKIHVTKRSGIDPHLTGC